MKKSMKLIARLMGIALMAGTLATAIADDKIFTSEVYVIPEDRLDPEMMQEVQEPEPQPKEEEQPTEEPGTADPEPEDVPEEDGPVERKVRITSSRGDVVIENEIITLSSQLIGFDGVDVQYQWQVDRGEGWADVDGATGPTHQFVATRDTILYSWRLIVTADE